MSFQSEFANGISLNYYILTSKKKLSNDWKKIDSRVTSNYVYFPQGLISVYSEKWHFDIKDKHTSFEKLICLSCFYHILRSTLKIRATIMDEEYRSLLQAWRTPCETTAVFISKDEGIFYLEGCYENGLYWKNVKEKPITIPPFVSCGSLDSNGGCWYEDCPDGMFVEDNNDLEVSLPII
jgi:hypothetical protein